MKKIAAKCPHCSHEFEVEISAGSLLAKGTGSDARKAAQKITTARPRPGAKGKAKPRKPKVSSEESPD